MRNDNFSIITAQPHGFRHICSTFETFYKYHALAQTSLCLNWEYFLNTPTVSNIIANIPLGRNDIRARKVTISGKRGRKIRPFFRQFDFPISPPITSASRFPPTNNLFSFSLFLRCAISSCFREPGSWRNNYGATEHGSFRSALPEQCRHEPASPRERIHVPGHRAEVRNPTGRVLLYTGTIFFSVLHCFSSDSHSA